MAKFKLKMKLQGFELEVEGSREDVPLITQNLGHQIAGLLQPAGAIIEGEVVKEKLSPSAAAPIAVPSNGRKPRKRRPAVSGSVDQQDKELPVDWKHDPGKYGTPKQGWSTAKKAIWLLHVVSEVTDNKELSAPRIAATFNKHFRQAGAILQNNVTRDLGRMKIKKKGPSPVSEDTTQSPAQWYLTEEGSRVAQKLVSEALGRSA